LNSSLLFSSLLFSSLPPSLLFSSLFFSSHLSFSPSLPGLTPPTTPPHKPHLESPFPPSARVLRPRHADSPHSSNAANTEDEHHLRPLGELPDGRSARETVETRPVPCKHLLEEMEKRLPVHTAGPQQVD